MTVSPSHCYLFMQTVLLRSYFYIDVRENDEYVAFEF